MHLTTGHLFLYPNLLRNPVSDVGKSVKQDISREGIRYISVHNISFCYGVLLGRTEQEDHLFSVVYSNTSLL
jgi:hypothetical protein